MRDPSARPGSGPDPSAGDDYASAVADIVNHVAKLPNCDRLVYREPAALEDVRGRLRRTAESLERIVRHGAAEDVEGARRAALACQLALVVLDGVQRLQAEGPK